MTDSVPNLTPEEEEQVQEVMLLLPSRPIPPPILGMRVTTAEVRDWSGGRWPEGSIFAPMCCGYDAVNDSWYIDVKMKTPRGGDVEVRFCHAGLGPPTGGSRHGR